MTPRVSVLMTIFNAEPFLKESLDSLLGQDYAQWELIAVENGSKDASPEILAGYSDPRIRKFAFHSNIGRTAALRYAFSQARAEYIAVLDADDVALPGRLQRQVEYLDSHPETGLVGAWADEIDSQGALIGSFRPPADESALRDWLGWSNPFVHSAVMYRSSLARDVGGYPESIVHSQDYSLVLKLAQRSGLGMIEEVLCKLRSAPSTMTNDPSLQLVRAREALELLTEARETLRLSPAALSRNRRRRAVAKLKVGLALMKAKRLGAGVRYVVSGVLSDPSALIDNGRIRGLLGKLR